MNRDVVVLARKAKRFEQKEKTQANAIARAGCAERLSVPTLCFSYIRIRHFKSKHMVEW